MVEYARILVIFVHLQACLCYDLDCPTFCICYVWQRLNRIDCVKQGLLHVDIGLNGATNFGGEYTKKNGSYLQVMDLSHNSISVLENEAFISNSLVNIEAIHLAHNSIAHVSPSAFHGLKNLRLLDLSHNRLRRNPGTALQGFSPHPLLLPAEIFEDLPNLRALRLGSNPLENEDHHGMNNIKSSPLLRAPQLEFLDLGSCHLGHVGSDAFNELKSLRLLNLSDNQLITLSPSALKNMKNLEEIILSSNPWPCQGYQEMDELDIWLSSHNFKRVCPMRKFEKLEVLNPKDLGPQKAEDDESLLYYYKLLGMENGEKSKNVYPNHESITPHEVEVFHEQGIRKLDKLSILESDVPSFSNNSCPDNDLRCSVNGIRFLWFLVFAFQAGVLLAFLATFCWFTRYCNNICGTCKVSKWADRRNSSILRRQKRMSRGEQFPSFLRNQNQRENDIEGCLLLPENETDILNMGITTPVFQRAANANRNNTPLPPTYEEHLTLHPIQTDS